MSKSNSESLLGALGLDITGNWCSITKRAISRESKKPRGSCSRASIVKLYPALPSTHNELFLQELCSKIEFHVTVLGIILVPGI